MEQKKVKKGSPPRYDAEFKAGGGGPSDGTRTAASRSGKRTGDLHRHIAELAECGIASVRTEFCVLGWLTTSSP